MNKKLLFLIAFIILSSGLNAQNFQWAKQIAGLCYSGINNTMAVDHFGNIYTTGKFSGTFDFDPGPATYYLTSAGSTDIFITKSDLSGNLIRAVRIGGSAGDGGNSIATDGLGNIYVSGIYYGTIDFNPDTGVQNLVSTNVGVFVLKLDSSLNFIWAHGPYNNTDYSTENSISVDNAGCCYLMARYSTLTAILFKISPSGFTIRTKSFYGNGVITLKSIIHDDEGKIYVVGEFSNIENMGTGNRGINGLRTDFVLKLDSLLGVAIWVYTITDSVRIFSIDAGPSGSVYMTGSFTGSANFATGYYFNSNGLNDIFVAKLNANGTFVWAKSMGGIGIDKGFDIAIDDTGNIYTTGFFNATVDFDPGIGVYYLSSAGGSDIFISKQNNLGEFAWAKKFGNNSHDTGTSVLIDHSGNFYATGSYNGQVDFDPGPGTYYLNSGGTSAYVLKMGTCGLSITTQPNYITVSIGGNAQFIVNTPSNTASYQWQQNSGSGFVNLTNAGLYSGVNSNMLTISNVPYSKNNYTYRCVITEGACTIVSYTALLTVVCDFNISAQPVNKSAPVGSSVLINVGTTSTSANYQWQQNSGSGFVNLSNGGIYSGVNTNILMMNPVSYSLNNYTYRCLISNGNCNYITDTARLTVNCAYNINRQPSNISVNSGATAMFTIQASSPTATYRWQEKSGTKFLDITDSGQYTGTGNDTLFISNTTLNQNNKYYRCRVVDEGCPLTSDSAKLIISCVSTISLQPVNKTINIEEDAHFVVKSTAPTTTFQWQQNTGSGFVNLTNSGQFSGVTKDTLRIGKVTLSQNYFAYRCILLFAGCRDTSNIAILTVNCTLAINTQPINQTVIVDSNARFIITASSPTATFQWQLNSGTGYINLTNSGKYTGVLDDTLYISKTSFSQNNYSFRCVVMDKGCTKISNPALLKIDCRFSIIEQPVNQSALINTDARFTIKASKSTLSYQWQEDQGTGFVNLSNNSSITGVYKDTLRVINVSSSQNNLNYRCLVDDSGCQVISNAAKLTVTCPFNITYQPANQTVNVGSNTKFIIGSSDPTVNFQWQQNTGLGFTNLINDNSYSGVTNDTLNITNINFSQNNYLFRCIISAGNCQLISDEARLTTNCNLNIVLQPQNQTASVQSKAMFLIVVSNSFVNYQWQRNVGSGFINLSNTFQYEGVFNDTLILSYISISQNNNLYRCQIDFNGCYTNSDSAILNVWPTGIEPYYYQKSFVIYPNPSDEQLSIEVNNFFGDMDYSISDAQGKMLVNGKINNKITLVNMGLLSPGLYFVRVGNDTRKLMKQ
ncbi:MAG: T9SS type A sorting domain-containing protein [Bacteroidota bacterium]|nr:T9SS type A sorting domain-containing protein [Bacteroidota bacterium]